MIHFGRGVRNTGQTPRPEYYEGSSAQWHQDGSSDTGTSHTIPGRGYLILCEWCEDGFFARTRAESYVLFREHEDAMHAKANELARTRCSTLDHEHRQCDMKGPHALHMTFWGEGLGRTAFVWFQGSSPMATAREDLQREHERARDRLDSYKVTDLPHYQEAYTQFEAARDRLQEFDVRFLS